MINFVMEHLPWFWFALLIIFVVIESFSFALTTIWAALASLPMIFIARTGLPFKWQLLIFALVTLALVIFTRPFAIKKLKLGKEKMNVNSLVGQEVLLVKDIEPFQKGEAKSKNGTIWTVTTSASEIIKEGAVCTVVNVNGNTLEIEKKE